MAYGEDIIKFRQRVQDAIKSGLVSEEGKDMFEGTLLQIMNDAERNRQNCLVQAENLRKQASVYDGQAAAFASVGSIVFNVINGFVALAEKAEKEKAARLEEDTKSQEEVTEEIVNVELANTTEVVVDNKKKTSRKK